MQLEDKANAFAGQLATELIREYRERKAEAEQLERDLSAKQRKFANLTERMVSLGVISSDSAENIRRGISPPKPTRGHPDIERA